MPLLSIDDLRNVHDNVAPNQAALDNLSRVVSAAERWCCRYDALMVSAEGGAAAVWTRTNAYADIECSNDGSIHALLMRGKFIIDTWEVIDIGDAIQRVNEHLHGAAKSQCGGGRP